MTKRILYLETTREGVVGGSHTCLYELVKGLDRSKYEPLVILSSDIPIRKEFEKVCKVILVARKFRGPSHQGHFAPSKVRATGRYLSDIVFDLLPGTLTIVRIIRQEGIDIIHVNNALEQGCEAIMAAKLCRIPCIVHQRGIGKVNRLARFLSKYVDVLICISEAVRQRYLTERVSPKRVVRIYDGIDFLTTVPMVSSEMMQYALGIENKGPIVGIVGTIQPWKGQREVILAIKEVKKQFQDIRCLIVGGIFDPVYRNEIKKLVAELELTDNIYLLGYRKDVLDVMNTMDVVIHASTSPEPFGRVLIEAMTLGKPLIATRAGGPLEIIEDRVNGLLVPPRDPEALGSAVKLLLENKMFSAKIAEAGRERVKQLFTLGSTIQETENIYAEL